MCGINGFSAQSTASKSNPEEVISRMNSALLHRGPDHVGSTRAGSFHIGMQRLSIVDISTGNQPMATADNRYSIVYNGEIYDYQDQRTKLQSTGTRFQTHSDTEVVLQGFAAEGPGFCKKLNGIFGFAVVDALSDEIWLVRDQLGIKPLYYYHQGETLVFSSELNSLVQHPAVPRKLNYSALASLLCDRSVPETGTMFDGVQQVPPGHILHFSDGKVSLQQYYNLSFQPTPMEEGPAIEQLTQLLNNAIQSQLVADVPVGAFLSGGIDSSTVVALAQAQSTQQLHTFSMGFSVAEYDESKIAAKVAQHLGTNHHTLTVENSAYDRSLLETIVHHTGQPLGDTSCIPTLLVSRFAAKHVKVVLSGDGGDEFFGGYPHINWANAIFRYSKFFPKLLNGPLSALLGMVPNSAPNALTSRCRHLRRAIDLFPYSRPEQMRRLMSMWTPEEVDGLLLGNHELLPTSPLGFPSDDSLDGASYAMEYLAKTYMVSGILSKVDRMSMAASLEVRVPLLDQRVVNFALKVPTHLKIQGGVGKYLLRQVGKKHLPAVVYDHPKQGFSPPLGHWFNNDFWADLKALYQPGSDPAQIFDPALLDTCINQAKNAQSNTSQVSYDNATNRVWVLAQLGIWMQKYRVAV